MKPVSFCTLPRSGTWYSFYFFEFLNAVITRGSKVKAQHGFEEYQALGFKKYHVHSIFPGFLDEYQGPFRKHWNLLEFHHPGVNYGYKLVEKERDVFFPSRNADARVVYFYRNPLDQAVSLFHHQSDSKVEETDQPVLKYLHHGQTLSIGTPAEFLRIKGIDSFIKQYFTFHVMLDAYRANLLMVPYEEMVTDPEKTFISILAFVGFRVDDGPMRQAVKTALELVSMEKMKDLESKLGRSLAGDQLENHSHMRGGQIGKWTDHLSHEDVNFTAGRLRAFDLSLDDFILTPP